MTTDNHDYLRFEDLNASRRVLRSMEGVTTGIQAGKWQARPSGKTDALQRYYLF